MQIVIEYVNYCWFHFCDRFMHVLVLAMNRCPLCPAAAMYALGTANGGAVDLGVKNCRARWGGPKPLKSNSNAFGLAEGQLQ